MRGLSLSVVFACVCAARASAQTPPASQTLEALRGARVESGDQVFDGYASRIHTLEPVEFAPLPEPVAPPLDIRPKAAQVPVTFDSRRIAPDVVVHAPRERPAASSTSRAGGYAAVAVGGAALAAGLIAGGGLLLPLAAAGAAFIALGGWFLLS